MRGHGWGQRELAESDKDATQVPTPTHLAEFVTFTSTIEERNPHAEEGGSSCTLTVEDLKKETSGMWSLTRTQMKHKSNKLRNLRDLATTRRLRSHFPRDSTALNACNIQ